MELIPPGPIGKASLTAVQVYVDGDGRLALQQLWPDNRIQRIVIDPDRLQAFVEALAYVGIAAIAVDAVIQIYKPKEAA
jgi:hypothetical protein